MKRALIVVGVAVALLVAADIGGRALAERAVGRDLASALHLSSDPSVSLGGEPFLLHAVTGHVPTVTVDGEDMTSGGTTFRRVHVSLTNVTFPPFALATGKPATIRAASGRGTATLTATQVNALLPPSGIDVRVRFDHGRVLATLPVVGDVAVRIQLAGNRILLRPADVPLPVSLAFPLPAALPGIRYTGVAVQGDSAVIGFRLDHPSFVANARSG